VHCDSDIVCLVCSYFYLQCEGRELEENRSVDGMIILKWDWVRLIVTLRLAN